MRLYSSEYITTKYIEMMSSSMVIDEAQIRSKWKRVATANFAQSKGKAHRVREKIIRKYFLICEFCFWCSSCCEELNFGCESSLRIQYVTTKNASCPACGTDMSVDFLPISSDLSEKPSIGESFH
jgi:hypothetical protein